MDQQEVITEVEAVQSVYGDDCQVIEAYPPRLHVHLKPRTADVSSQQFVEATIRVWAGLQYPKEPPDITIVESKGLDERRQNYLITSIQEKGFELISCLMLVALCEEAVERLSSMNHPDGECPLCLYPLLDEDGGSNSQPFMKLMSCFHCLHCDCMIRWWNWINLQGEKETSSSTFQRTKQDQEGMHKMMEGSMGHCPVCREVFLAKDIEHVLDLVGTNTPLDSGGIEIDGDILLSDSEKIRRQKFEAILKLQQENSGLIEPKRNEVLLPGVFLPQPVTQPSTEANSNPPSTELNKYPSSTSMEEGKCNPPSKHGQNPGSSFSRPGSRKHNNANMNTRKHKPQNQRKQGGQWIRKDGVSEK